MLIRHGNNRIAGWHVIHILLLLVLGILPVYAAGQTSDSGQGDVVDYREAVVRIVSSCGTEEQPELSRRVRTGFLVGQSGSEPYVVTTWQGLEYSAAEKKAVAAEHGLEENQNLKSEVCAVFRGDVKVTLSLVNGSQERDLSVWRMNTGQSDRFRIPLYDGDPDTPFNAAAACFPVSMESEGNRSYNENTISVIEGQVTGRARQGEAGIAYYRHAVIADEGASGAPILSPEGWVVGMYLTSPSGEPQGGLALRATEIRDFLVQHNIPCDERKPDPAPGPAPDPPVPKYIHILLLVIVGLLASILIPVIRRSISSGQPLFRENMPKIGSRRARSREAALLLRRSEHSIIPVQGETFLIGTDIQRVQYHINNNPRISSMHACISQKGGQYYLEDLGSTNGTFLDGRRLMPGSRAELQNDCRILLADEEFIFRNQ